jgi:hypothetical protein
MKPHLTRSSTGPKRRPRAPEPPIRPEASTAGALAARGPAEPEPTEPSAVHELRGLLALAQGGDTAALPGLRAIFDLRPELWTWLSDLARHAEESWIGVIGGTDLGLAEALQRRTAALKTELVGPKPTAIERLLAERVVATWLYTNWADAMVARVSVPVASASTRLQAFAEARAERAQRRHQAAVAGLLTLQRLLHAKRQSETETEPDAAGMPRRSTDVGPRSESLHADLSLGLYGGLGGEPEQDTPVRRRRRPRAS